MPVVIDPATKASFQSLVNPSNSLNTTWTNPNTGVTYTINNGFQNNTNVNGQAADNVKYQAQPDGTVYVYTVHNSITSSADDPDTAINEAARHSGIVTYAINRDAATGDVTMTVHQVQDSIVDSAGNEFTMPTTSAPTIERFSTDQGEFMLVKYFGPVNQDNDGDGDLDAFRGTAIYSLDAQGNATPVDAKVWDAPTNAANVDTVANNPEAVNTDYPSSPYVSSVGATSQNFTFVKAADGTPVLMQQIDATSGSLIAINPDGTFGEPTIFSYPASAASTDDDALNAMFTNTLVGGSVSVTVDGRTFIYGSRINENWGRAELSIDANGAPQLTNITFSSDNQSEGLFTQTQGSIDVVTGANTILAAPDIGDGNKYLLIGNAANWQYVKVNPDGSLGAASDLENDARTNIDSLSGSLAGGPISDLTLVEYDVNGTTYKGWMTQSDAASDARWWFYNPQTGFVAMTPQSGTGAEEPGTGDKDYFMINGHPTWVGTNNTVMGKTATPVAWVADGGTVTPLVCFVAGTKILTDRGVVAIENLKVGDLVETVDRGLQPIRWIGSRQIPLTELLANEKLRPIQILAGALGTCIPHQDVMVSPQHRVLLRSKLVERMFGTNEVLTAAKNLLNLP
ncbi:MAG: Hint domain-containing protein, partial [Plesiomonas shigelloides]